MAKNTVIDEAPVAQDGLMVLPDPFGNGDDKIVGYSEAGDWEVLVDDWGPDWDFQNNPILVGTLIHAEVILIPETDDDGEITERPTVFYSFEHYPTNERVRVWDNYVLNKALGGIDTPYMGRILYMEWKGKKEIGKRSLNTFTVLVKK